MQSDSTRQAPIMSRVLFPCVYPPPFVSCVLPVCVFPCVVCVSWVWLPSTAGTPADHYLVLQYINPGFPLSLSYQIVQSPLAVVPFYKPSIKYSALHDFPCTHIILLCSTFFCECQPACSTSSPVDLPTLCRRSHFHQPAFATLFSSPLTIEPLDHLLCFKIAPYATFPL